jgi:hypothetical protein
MVLVDTLQWYVHIETRQRDGGSLKEKLKKLYSHAWCTMMETLGQVTQLNMVLIDTLQGYASIETRKRDGIGNGRNFISHMRGLRRCPLGQVTQ